ncbi:MAG: TonB-dependent receptor, partial [Steroidobacteraceae bacterium]
MSLALSAAATLVFVAAAPAQVSETPDETLDEAVVTGSTLRSQETVLNRRNAPGIVDSLTQDDTGDLADETLADALIRVPGVSSMQTLYGEQEAAYVSTRGISPDLNFTSFDGMALFSSANDGDGLRRVDLNLIPTQISRTTDVYKSFTADLDAGAIGGVINIQPRSALNGEDTFYMDAFTILQTGYGKYVPGTNSLGKYKDTPWGGGVKGLWSQSFGTDRQYGVVLSGVYRQRAFDYTKRNANNRIFYTSAGVATTNLATWDGQQPLPSLIRPMDYTHFTRTWGGSAQFEWQAAEQLQLSVLGYEYKQSEDQTFNQFQTTNYTNLVRIDADTARLKIGQTQSNYDNDRFSNTTRGTTMKAVKLFGSNSSLEARLGRNLNRFYNLLQTAYYSYTNPPNAFITYDMSELSDQVTIDNNEALLDASKYRLASAADQYTRARMTSTEGKLDFQNNYANGSMGFGFATGLDVRRVDAQRNGSTITYAPGTTVLGGIGFVPDISSWMYHYPVLWVDYAGFASAVKPGLALNQTATRNAEWSADYGYRETIMAGYASLRYATEKFSLTAGLRHDDVDYKANSPLATAGAYNGAFQRYTGDYANLLPSALLSYNLAQDVRIKAGFSQTLGRPAFGDIARAENRNTQTLTISRGNPDLKPRRADNFDLGLEYFFGGSSMVTLGGFTKDIKDDIYSLTTQQDIGGVMYDVTQPMNASSSKMRGVEFQIVTDSVPGLPGFLRDKVGASFNATRMWAEMDYMSGATLVHLKALQYQADWLANAAVFYRLPRDGELRVAYNWKSRSPISLGVDSLRTYWQESRGQLDAAFRWSLSERFILKIQA